MFRFCFVGFQIFNGIFIYNGKSKLNKMPLNEMSHSTFDQILNYNMDAYYILMVDIVGETYHDFTPDEWYEKQHCTAMIKLGIKRYFTK